MNDGGGVSDIAKSIHKCKGESFLSSQLCDMLVWGRQKRMEKIRPKPCLGVDTKCPRSPYHSASNMDNGLKEVVIPGEGTWIR